MSRTGAVNDGVIDDPVKADTATPAAVHVAKKEQEDTGTSAGALISWALILAALVGAIVAGYLYQPYACVAASVALKLLLTWKMCSSSLESKIVEGPYCITKRSVVPVLCKEDSPDPGRDRNVPVPPKMLGEPSAAGEVKVDVEAPVQDPVYHTVPPANCRVIITATPTLIRVDAPPDSFFFAGFSIACSLGCDALLAYMIFGVGGMLDGALFSLFVVFLLSYLGISVPIAYWAVHNLLFWERVEISLECSHGTCQGDENAPQALRAQVETGQRDVYLADMGWSQQTLTDIQIRKGTDAVFSFGVAFEVAEREWVARTLDAWLDESHCRITQGSESLPIPEGSVGTQQQRP